MTILQMSAAGAVMILTITVLRALTVHRLPKRTFLLLWGIVFLRLMLPFSVSSVFSVYSLWDREAPADAGVRGEASEMAVFWPGEAQGEAVEDTSWEMQDGLKRISFREIVWLSGMALCALYLVLCSLYWHREFRTSTPVDSAFVSGWLQRCRLKRSIRVRQSGRISAPLTYGIWKPVILLPESIYWENERQLECVLLHEYIHIRHYDAVLKLAAAAALCVHWFNPMVWLAYALFNRDIELACDEAVVKQLGEGNRGTYARTLIWMEEKRSGLAPAGNHFSRNAVEERITAIVKSRKATWGTLAVSGLAFAAIVLFFATSPKEGSRAADSGGRPADVEGHFAGGESGPGNGAGEAGGESGPGNGAGEAGEMTGFDGGGNQTADGAAGSGQLLYCMGRLYLSTGEDVSEMVAAEAAVSEYDSPYIGEIRSSLKQSETPAEELQSNFGQIGSEVIFNGSGIAVDMDGKWIQFYPAGSDVPDSTVFENLVNRIKVSIAYADGSFSFTIPESGSEWDILINGREEVEEFGGMSSHFLQELSESGEWKGGETYSFDVNEETLTELFMVVSTGEGSAVIDLMEYLPDSSAVFPG